MSLFDRFGRDDNSRPVPFFVSDGNSSQPPSRTPGVFYLNRNYDKWQDRIFLAFIRDRLLWIHNVNEHDPMIIKLNDIIHCACPNFNSTLDV